MISDTTEVQRYFDSLFARIPTAQYIPISADWDQASPDCHLNVAKWVDRDPSLKAVPGWLFGLNDEDGIYFMAHSVIEADGRLWDITPMIGDGPQLKFLRHLGTEAEFNSMRDGRSFIFYPLPALT